MTGRPPRRLLFIAGTRPELIKLAPLILAAERDPERSWDVHLVLTGQHRELVADVVPLFGLRPSTDLRAMQAGSGLSDLAARILGSLSRVLGEIQPYMVVVQGDTTSTLAGALAAFHAGLPVAHVEAGLRSGRMDAPFPEEANRRMVSILAAHHFAPTSVARDRLLAEGADPARIHVTGNTIVDALQEIRRRGLPPIRDVDPGVQPPFVLVTMHRRESVGAGLARLCDAVGLLAERHSEFQFVVPVHKNPDVESMVRSRLGPLKGVRLVPPQSYERLLALLQACAMVMTDSGGVQEEAPSFGKRCLVLRDVTERMEGVEAGVAMLVGTDQRRVVEGFESFLAAGAGPFPPNPYGDGRAAQRILEVLRSS